MKKGISLVALVITIIVLIILTATVLILFSEDGVINRAKEATFKSDFTNIVDSFTMNKNELMIQRLENININVLDNNSNKIDKLKEYIPIIETQGIESKKIKNIYYLDLIQIIDNTIYQSDNEELKKDEEIKGWLNDIGIYNYFDKIKKIAIIDPEQEKSKDIGIGTDGKPVNLDLWSYTKTNYTNKENYAVITDKKQYSNPNDYKGYIGEIVNGRIVGTIPQYIKFDGDDEFIEVREMANAFMYCSALIYPPEIPSTVTNMELAFTYCTNLKEAPVLPAKVTNLNHTFWNCFKLETTPIIPDGVVYMNYTFDNCNKITQTPVIPDSVKHMNGTFIACSKLTTVPNIPDGVEVMSTIFADCYRMDFPLDFKLPPKVTNLEGAFMRTPIKKMPVIPDTVTNMHSTFWFCGNLTTLTNIPSKVEDISQCFQGCNAVTGNLVIDANPTNCGSCFDRTSINDGASLILSGSSSMLETILNTKSSNSNITISDKQ